MSDYRAPTREFEFLLGEVFGASDHYASLEGCEKLTPELLDSVLMGARDFAEGVAAPLYRSGDQQGCRYEDGNVLTPDGFADAFRQYGEDGWQGLTIAAEEGGQGLPPSLGFMVTEMIGAANWAWSMYSGLAMAPVNCLISAGTPEQKAQYLPKILDGSWGGTMCLTEAHCGSDVGLIRTRATREDDGTYVLTGSKIFVSGGEQDMTENIIHSVLARVEGDPAGTKGLSLFIVPKMLVNEAGEITGPNAVSCGSIEHKMGLKGSATCVINFDGATGVLIGEECRGLEVMFEMMNTARLGTALQGLAMGELARQYALDYAQEREQMRSLTGPKNPDGEADPILVHPDVRRMILTQNAFVEGSRAFAFWLGQLIDLGRFGPEAGRQQASDLLEFLTPIAKAFVTETGQEVANLGLQVFGGHGYVADNGIEQVVRDGRISTVYEGTTGIQALDLIGRKVLANGGSLLKQVTALIRAFCAESASASDEIGAYCDELLRLCDEWEGLAATITDRAIKNLDELGSSSVDFLMYSGYIVLAYLWARMALAVESGSDASNAAYSAKKLATARFYFARLLPRTSAHAAAALAGAETLMSIPHDDFAI